MKIVTLKRPAEFKRVRGGLRWATPLFIIEARRRADATPEAADGPRFGFTITRKVGGAVVRNHIRRRLKEALRTLGAAGIHPDHDYVVVASRPVHDYPFAGLQDALREAFERLHRQAQSRGSRRGARKGVPPEGAPGKGRSEGTGSGSGVGTEPGAASEQDVTATHAAPGRRPRRQRL